MPWGTGPWPFARAAEARRAAGAFFLAQAVLCLGWWVALARFPALMEVFFAPALRPLWPHFLANDLLVYVLVGALAGWRLRAQDRRHGVWLAVLACAGMAVPTAATVAAAVQEGGGIAGVIAMSAGMAAGGAVTLRVYFLQAGQEAEFQPAADARHLPWRAFRQTTLLWILALLVWPTLIARAEAALGWPSFHGGAGFGLAALLGFGVLGLSATWVMAQVGRGTPLPGDCAPCLVAVGPYAAVRNPMAVAGIGQALGVGLMWGSPMVLLYAGIGALAWHFGARPREEGDLLLRFGADYAAYRMRVGLWVPRGFFMPGPVRVSRGAAPGAGAAGGAGKQTGNLV